MYQSMYQPLLAFVQKNNFYALTDKSIHWQNSYSKKRIISQTKIKELFMKLRNLFSGSVFVLGIILSPVTHSNAFNPTKESLSNSRTFNTARININTANAKTLSDNLYGIGAKRAQAIVAYRQQHGKFTAIEQLKKIKGISARIIEKNRNNLTF